MRSIRRLAIADYQDLAAITAESYPGLKIRSSEDRKRLEQRAVQMNRDPTIDFYGLFEEGKSGDDRLLGVMRHHDFTMKLLSTKTLVGGMGGLAVALLHRKEKIARDMVLFFLRHYRERRSCLATLYPFRPDFYKRMGFGFGAKLSQYRLKADTFPKGPSKSHITYLTPADKNAVVDCYNRFLEKTNGLFMKNGLALNDLFVSGAFKIAGFRQGPDIRGYIVFAHLPLDESNFLRNRMVIREFIYETPEAFMELLTFIHSQADQVEYVELNTQDDSFHHLPADPRNGSDHLLPSVWHESNVQGVGIMYRVIDVPRLFEVLADHDFGGQSCRLQLSITDTLLPENAGTTVVHFESGRPHLRPKAEHDVAVEMDVSAFSSLVVGAIPFERLITYGQAKISDDAHIETIGHIFHVDQKPLCMTNF